MSQSSPTSAGYLYQYTNCHILRGGKIIREDLWIRDGKIMDPEILFYVEKVNADKKIDCKNMIISPGFIDVQLNGGYGYDFSTDVNLEEGIEKVAHGLLSQGVTSFCPTIITSPPDFYHKVLPRIKKCNGSKKGAGVLGVHVEGPFICVERIGAHPKQCVRDYENGFSDVLETYGDLTNIAIVTLAPEKKNSMEVIEEFCKRGIVVSVGHSNANLVEGEEAVRSGARFITHLFNAMLPFHHRDPHLVGLLTSEKLPRNRRVFYGIIADGIHTHPAALRIAHRVHPQGTVLVTDAIQAMGLPDGTYPFGEQTIVVEGKRSYIKGTNTLAGSTATLDHCVRLFAKQTDCGIEKALEAASLHPAQLMGIEDKKGTLDFGTDADFIMLDDSLNVKATYIAGECVYTAP
ncbi:N-acetylglucosamine-6-phosphate deacetylase-like [Physella acuta]|uniref:N-acetylglucosamine-6-phosphate deacetylase-like n=1 Tax=Physella acuta TaxID=109671 RepID=UPI0027DBEB70|nr:N-acetylglucosamine-6-phosphate deacetylase-like [Physella acuta]XP_059169327.1 N-acetylglucosamine-6-phosphate deacetylase-like [Physella acuta]XP_059169328.1 N-acetylglucosamine-6-phosphate deacetylase-like [Physella acuta]XP_059169329.1 N-acetylglucosamine-6-phosphate deacetylase-like [Physella acuta]